VVFAASEHGQVGIEVTYKQWIARPRYRVRLRSLGVGLVVFAVELIGAEDLAYAGHTRTLVDYAAPARDAPPDAISLALAPSDVLHRNEFALAEWRFLAARHASELLHCN